MLRAHNSLTLSRSSAPAQSAQDATTTPEASGSLTSSRQRRLAKTMRPSESASMMPTGAASAKVRNLDSLACNAVALPSNA